MTETSPTAQRREVGTLLRAHRERVGLKLADAAERAGVSAAKLSRLERGLRGLQIADVRTLCEIYGLSEAETRELVAETRVSREPGWWEAFTGLSATAPLFFGLEMAATRIEEYDALIIPGLLQTAEYAEALTMGTRSAVSLTHEQVTERVEARTRRASLLLPQTDKRFHFIIDEAALWRAVGSPRVMAEQCTAILQAGVRPNVNVQLLPWSAGAHPGLAGAFIIQGFDQAAQRDAVFVEGMTGNVLIEQEGQVKVYRAAFAELTRVALTDGDSRELLQGIRTEWLGRVE